MPCIAPRPRFGGQPAYPNCSGPTGALELQCPWCRRSGRGNTLGRMAFVPAVAQSTGQWTDHYSPEKTQHNVSPLAIQQPAVRVLFAQLREGAATIVAGVSITPRTMQYLSQLADREIGLLTDRQGTGRLYLTMGGPTGISTPHPKASYRFLAHTHPTLSNRKDQITLDMKNASDDAVEIVITMDDLILFYEQGKCYNDRDGSRLRRRQDDLITMDTPLDVALFDHVTTTLQGPRNQPQLQQSVAQDMSWMDYL